MRASGERLNAEDFRLELDRRGLTQVDAARRMGVNDRTVRRWVLGERPIPPMVSKILDTIELKPEPEPEPEPVEIPADAGQPIDDGAAERLAIALAAAEAADVGVEPPEPVEVVEGEIIPPVAEEPAKPRRKRRKTAS